MLATNVLIFASVEHSICHCFIVMRTGTIDVMLYRSVALVVVACTHTCKRNLIEKVQYSSIAQLIHDRVVASVASTFAQEVHAHISADEINLYQELTHLSKHILDSSVEYTVIVEIQNDLTTWRFRHGKRMVTTALIGMPRQSGLLCLLMARRKAWADKM